MPEWHIGELSERDENNILLNLAYSEFLSLECFWVLFAQKVQNRKLTGLDSRLRGNDGIRGMLCIPFFVPIMISL